MGFNITEISNKNLPVKNVFQENPLSDSRGQNTVSVSEPWELRMSRLGLVKNIAASSAGVPLTQGTFTTLYTSLASAQQRAGYSVIPIVFRIMANGGGFASFEYMREPGGTMEYEQFYIPPGGGTWECKLEGSIITGNLATFTAKFKADDASKVGWFFMRYAEVSI